MFLQLLSLHRVQADGLRRQRLVLRLALGQLARPHAYEEHVAK